MNNKKEIKKAKEIKKSIGLKRKQRSQKTKKRVYIKHKTDK